jgi:hypothetical protein
VERVLHPSVVAVDTHSQFIGMSVLVVNHQRIDARNRKKHVRDPKNCVRNLKSDVKNRKLTSGIGNSMSITEKMT